MVDAKCSDITAAERASSDVSSVSDDVKLYNTMLTAFAMLKKMLTAYANHGLIYETINIYIPRHDTHTQLQLAPTPATFGGH